MLVPVKRRKSVFGAWSIVLSGSLIAMYAAWADGPASPDPRSPPPSQLQPAAPDDNPCLLDRLSSPLTLFDAVNRTLCGNPKTRAAWATIKLNTAVVRSGKEAYRPSLGGTVKELESSTQTRLNHDPQLDTSSTANYPIGSLSFSWVLYDFGQRGEQLESAKQLLAAAWANLDLSQQQVFLQAAADYYDAQAAQASLDAARQIEALTKKSVDAAHFRVEKGVSPISDELQARTANAQAVVDRVKAEADLKTKRGGLAGDMGLDPDRAITITQADPNINAQGNFVESLHELIAEAKRNHPSVAVAERALAAAKADEKAARAHGYPVISVVAGLSRSNQPLTPSLGSPSVPGSVRERSIGIQIDLPLSDALWKRGLIAQAHAQVAVKQETLFGTEQQVALDVWNSYSALQAGIDNLTNSQALLESAQKSFESTQHRYEGGVGSILELLSSQSAYANAAQQRIRALSDWRIARLALGASLGRLDLRALEEGR
jgi:outer membrane protein